jgi:hypothetical protein
LNLSVSSLTDSRIGEIILNDENAIS